MRQFLIALINLTLLGIALATGFFVFLVLAVAGMGLLIYWRFRYARLLREAMRQDAVTPQTRGQVIDAEYREVDSKSSSPLAGEDGFS